MKEPTCRVHEGTKPFLYDSCEESFAKDFKLKLHIKGIQGGKSRFHVLCVAHNFISLSNYMTILKQIMSRKTLYVAH